MRIVTTIMILLLLASCTSKLWKEDSRVAVTITGFYINEKDSSLLVSTKEGDGYIFPIDKAFAESLKLSRSISFTPDFVNFSVSDLNEVTGDFSMYLVDENLDTTQLDQLRALGFKQSRETGELYLSRSLKGKRYEIEGDLPFDKLEHSYVIWTDRPDSFISKAGKIVATPFTVAVDAVVISATVFVAVTIIGVARFHQSMKHQTEPSF